MQSKKGHSELLCRTDTDSQTLRNIQFPKETVWGVGGCAGVWDGNPIKLDCDDHCTAINVINSLSNKKIKNFMTLFKPKKKKKKKKKRGKPAGGKHEGRIQGG